MQNTFLCFLHKSLILAFFYLTLIAMTAACAEQPARIHQLSANTGTATVKLPDSSVYTGEVKNGLFNGKGELRWRNGDLYKGEFKDGMMQGKGEVSYKSGESYQGEFVSGLYEGSGVLVTTTGDRYEGEFKEGDFHGDGILKTTDGTVFKCRFHNGLPSGNGTITWTNGNSYVGYIKNWRMEGKGKFTEKNIGEYTGEFSDGYYHGSGTYKFNRGDVYVGQFKQGLISGEGKLKRATGEVYTGEFASGQFHGKGEFVDSSGRIFRGEFRQGEFSGQGDVVYANGIKYSGEISNWMEHGKGTITFPNGTVYKGDFDQATMHGSGTLTMPNGEHYTGEFNRGVYDGKGELTFASGDRYAGQFKQGLFDGKGTYYYGDPKGKKPQFEGEWNNGVLVLMDGEKLDRKRDRKDKLFVEEALYQQYPLMNKTFDAIAPGVPSVPELYFLSFGSYDAQDVFMKEALFSRQLFDSNFITTNRSVALINHRNTAEEYPLATVGNLKRALLKIGEKMNNEEDILFLFISSHGSKNQGVNVRLGGINLEDLSAEHLSSMLKESRIKWKVIVISACYSGTFIEELKDENTMIITSSKPDHVSFGCSDDAEFTYFGRAFFKHALKDSSSFKVAFTRAKQLVHGWESEKKYSHSEPQISTSDSIEKMLSNWRKSVQK